MNTCHTYIASYILLYYIVWMLRVDAQMRQMHLLPFISFASRLTHFLSARPQLQGRGGAVRGGPVL